MYLRLLSALTLTAAIASAGCTTSPPVNNLRRTATPVTPPQTPLKTALGDIMCTNPLVVYPQSGRVMEAQGTVLLHIHVDANGFARDVAVVKSSGWEMLDKEAVRAARVTQCVPFADPKTGTPIAVTATKAIRFVLDDVVPMAAGGTPAATRAPAAPQQ